MTSNSPSKFRPQVIKIIEDYDEKLERSGYSRIRRTEILKSGLIGYKRKARRHIMEAGHVHRPGFDPEGKRIVRKVTGKTTLFKEKGRGEMKLDDL